MTLDEVQLGPMDSIGALAQISDSLATQDANEAVYALAMRALTAEAARYTIENASVDTGTTAYRQLRAALTILESSQDWLTPPLTDFLRAYWDVARSPTLPYDEEATRIESADGGFTLLEWRARGSAPFTVSNAYASTVAVIERTLGDPRYCAQLVEAFARRVEGLRKRFKVDHLAFIEKEAGPVGAVTMMSSLVRATGLPACVFRETHWADRAALSGTLPAEGSRVAIVYDLIVSGSAIHHAADKIRELTGAKTCGAVVLSSYREDRELRSPKGQRIAVEALHLNRSTITPESMDAVSGADPEPAVVAPIPPGTYTAETLPPIDARARAIVDRIWAQSEKDEDRRAPARPAAGKPRGRLRLVDRGRPGVFAALRKP